MPIRDDDLTLYTFAPFVTYMESDFTRSSPYWDFVIFIACAKMWNWLAPYYALVLFERPRGKPSDNFFHR